MRSDVLTSVVSVALAIIGVSIVALIVSGNAGTSELINAVSKGFGGDLSCALSPITGGSCGTSVSSSVSFN